MPEKGIDEVKDKALKNNHKSVNGGK